MKSLCDRANICDMCIHNKRFPLCCPDNVVFGRGTGNDNIISCDNCEVKNDGEIN